MLKPPIIASELLIEALRRHDIHLSLLVADTGLWVNPAFHARLTSDTGSCAVFPNVRRARIGQGEKRGQVVEGIRFDDNSYANLAIKRACGLGKSAQGFEACHIWPLTCYDERYHTAVANIVLLPRALASLTDHDSEIQRALQYRAFELYAWRPHGLPAPAKPDFYPTAWREPRPDALLSGVVSAAPPSEPTCDQTPEAQHGVLSERIAGWNRKPNSNVHRIIALVVQARDGISRHDLVNQIAEVTSSKNPYGAVASLLTNRGNAYGRILVDSDGIIRIHREVEDQVRSLNWVASYSKCEPLPDHGSVSLGASGVLLQTPTS